MFKVLRQLSFTHDGGMKRGVDSGLHGNLRKRGDVTGFNGRRSVMKREPSSCTLEYKKLGHSTMCEYEDSPDAKNMGNI